MLLREDNLLLMLLQNLLTSLMSTLCNSAYNLSILSESKGVLALLKNYDFEKNSITKEI